MQHISEIILRRMEKLDYLKYIVGDGKDFGSRAVLLRTAIENARKRNGRVAGFRKMHRKQLYAIVSKKQKNT